MDTTPESSRLRNSDVDVLHQDTYDHGLTASAKFNHIDAISLYSKEFQCYYWIVIVIQ